MTNLLPLSDYLNSATLDRVRFGLVAGAFFTVAMGLFFAVALAATAGTSWRAWLLVGAAALIPGALFGVAMPFLLEWRLKAGVRRAYAAVGKYAAPSPGAGYTHRLPATLLRSASFGVGGVLFAGPGRAAFVPHGMNLPAHRAAIDIPTGDSFQISLAPAEKTPLQRMLVSREVEVLQLSVGDGSWRFAVPSPETTARELERVVQGR